jgi:protein-S-isoprenylcysteine O-methyltransferase Ste14
MTRKGRSLNIMTRSRRHGNENRADLAGEHRWGDTGQIILAVLFAAVWISDTFIFGYTTFLNDIVPVVVRVPLAAIFFILSAYLSFRGLAIVFGEVREQPTVIRTSVFGLVRHPIYLGEILVYLGFLCLNISLAAAVVWLLAIGFLHHLCRYEERLLASHFDDEYRRYMREVPMWIPFTRKRIED